MVWGWDQKNHVSKWREGWLEQRQRVVVFVCNPNQREAGPSFNWEKAQRLKKTVKEEPVPWKGSVCFANQHYLVIGEPLGDLEAGRFQLVLKGLEKNVKYMNTEHKKLPKGADLWDFWYFLLLFKRKCQRRNAVFQYTSVSVIQVPSEHRFSAFSLFPPTSCWGRGQRDGVPRLG